MSRASCRREQLRQLFDTLPPDRSGAAVMLGLSYAPAVIILDVALAGVLSRAAFRSWQARHDGLASALRTGVNPTLIGLVGALTVNEVIRALVFRAMIRPAINGAASSAQRTQPFDP